MTDRPTAPLSAILSLVNDKALSRKNPDLIYVGLEDIPSSGTSLLSHGWATDSVSTNNVFQEGDVLFGKLRPRLRKSIRIDRPGYCSTDILVLRPTANVDPGFAGYVAQSDAVFTKAVRTEEGTKMPRCSWQQIQSARVYLPNTRKEQAEISRLLASVDGAIGRSAELVAKYQQIKFGLMHDLFTRGVLPDGTLRSQRECAPELYQETSTGWIPADWEPSTAGAEFWIDSGITLGPHRRTAENPHHYLRVANVHRDEISLEDVATLERLPGDESCSLNVGDLLLVEGHANPSEIGRCAMVPEAASGYLFQNHLFRLRPKRLQPDFSLRWLNSQQSVRYWERNCSTSSGLNTINRKILSRLPVHVPSPEEQIAIQARAEAINRQIETERQVLRKLQSQKAGLMQDLLTGRISVASLASEPADA
jgi:type I restriction enzyme S subunit